MLNLTKFNSKYRVNIGSCVKMIHEWNTEEGQGNYISEYYLGDVESFTVAAEDIDKLGEMIIKSINQFNFSDYQESDFNIIDGRFCWCQLENEWSFITTEGDYICDYDVYITINGIELTEEELREVFPRAN